ncbi:MAG TPA: hypothetical protein VIQ77_12350 [Mucilaginibacter sp.]
MPLQNIVETLCFASNVNHKISELVLQITINDTPGFIYQREKSMEWITFIRAVIASVAWQSLRDRQLGIDWIV